MVYFLIPKSKNIDFIVFKILDDLSFKEVTKGLEYYEIYKQRGKGLKIKIQREKDKVYNIKCNDYSLFKQRFINKLRDENLIEENQVKNENIERVKNIFIHMYNDFLFSKEREKANKIKSNNLTVSEFFDLKKEQQGDFVGVYILYNATKRMYYVGQATKIFFRINQHFTGKGNGDIYADYKYGDIFYIGMIKLSESGYDDLNKLEKDKIKEYDAFEKGYNKTKGNKS